MKAFFSVCLTLMAFIISAQTTGIDSLKHRLSLTDNNSEKITFYFQLGGQYFDTSVDSSLHYYKQSLRLNQGINDSLFALGNHRVGSIYLHDMVQLDSALWYANRGIDALDRFKDEELRQKLQSTIANTYLEKGEFDLAVKLHLENAQLADKIGNPRKKAWSYSGVAEAYRLQNNGQKALEYMEKAYEVSLTLGDEDARTKDGMLLNLALAYDKNGQMEKGVAILEEKKATGVFNSDFSRAIIMHNLGRFYILQERFDEAESMLLDAMSVEAWSRINRRKLATMKELTTLYIDRGDVKNGVEMGEKTYQLAKELDIQYHLEDATRNLSEAYAKDGQFEQGLKLQKEYIDILKSIFDEKQSALMLEMDGKYLASEKQNRILLLEKEQASNERKLYFLLTGIAFVLSAVGIFGWFYRKKNKLEIERQALALQLEKDEKEMIELRLRNEEIYAEKQRQEKEIVELELKLKDRELTTNAMSLLQKKEQYDAILKKLQSLKGDATEAQAKVLTEIINEAKVSSNSYNWEEFQLVFERVHTDFYENLSKKFPQITPNERKLSAFLKLGMSTKDISAITNQTSHSILIARSRLRKKLGLEKEESLSKFIGQI